VPAPEELEQELSVISNENHVLADEVRRVRSDFEQAREEEHRKIVDLEQVRQAMQRAREEDQRKLAELESSNGRYATAREADRRKIGDLEQRLAGLEDAHRQARDRVQALEGTLREATLRLEQADGQIRELQLGAVEQAKQFQASLNEATERLGVTDNQVKVLGTRLDDERQQVLKSFEALQGRLRRQDVRMNWTITAASFAVLLGTAAGVILIRDVQHNATLLAGMSRDIKDLMTSVTSRSGMQQPPPPTRQSLAPTATPAVPPAKPARPAAKPATVASPTIKKTEPNPYLLGSAFERGRSTNREGVRQPLREEARSFFAKNAKVPGVISLPSGVQYRVTQAGSGKPPLPADQVVLSYVGTKLDGTVIDETYSGGAPATLGMQELLPAWREVLLKMKEGAEFELYIPPDQATRRSVRNRGVTGFEPTIYLIELQQVVRNVATGPSAPVQ
jgi:FKBP-type peptidyl-prolyl cis-trans isomerase